MTKESFPLLERALQGKSEQYQQLVWDLVQLSNLQDDDPAIVMLVATGRLELMLLSAPQEIEQVLKTWNTNVTSTFELVSQSLIQRQKLAIAQAAGDLIRTAERQEAQRFFGSLAPAAGVLLAVFGLGVVFGYAMYVHLGGGLSKLVPNQLTMKQAEALEWATSAEGQYARNLMKWNKGYLDNRACDADVKRLNVKLLLDGRPVKEGFCTIWTIPPEQRKYAE